MMSDEAMVMAAAGELPVAVERPVPQPGPGEAVVRVRASSMSIHDLVNLMGLIEGPWARLPMSDDAGEVASVGDGVTRVAVGDRVISTFHPGWLGGRPTPDQKRVFPGDICDGWLQQCVCYPAEAIVVHPVGVTVGSGAADADLCQAVTLAEIQPQVSHLLGWDEVPEAMRLMRASEHVGKIAITIP